MSITCALSIVLYLAVIALQFMLSMPPFILPASLMLSAFLWWLLAIRSLPIEFLSEMISWALCLRATCLYQNVFFAITVYAKHSQLRRGCGLKWVVENIIKRWPLVQASLSGLLWVRELTRWFCLQGWFVLSATKIVLGFWLREAAGAYLRHFERRKKKTAARAQLPSRSTAIGDISKIAKKEWFWEA